MKKFVSWRLCGWNRLGGESTDYTDVVLCNLWMVLVTSPLTLTEYFLPDP